LALGAAAGEVAFSHGADTTNHVLGAGEPQTQADRVRLDRLDTLFEPSAPAFIKIDVEGFEAEVLAGAREALRDPALIGLLVEDNEHKSRTGGGGGVVEQLLGLGFGIFRYDPATRELRAGTAEQGTANLLFLRDRAKVAERVQAARKFRLVNGWI
jgi:hypothetical protein